MATVSNSRVGKLSITITCIMFQALRRLEDAGTLQQFGCIMAWPFNDGYAMQSSHDT